MTLAIIGGTGLSQLDGFECVDQLEIHSEFGAPSAPVMKLKARHRDVCFYFLPRHGNPHSIAPHRINYRANIDVLSQLDVSGIVAVNAVGGIDPVLTPEQLVLPTQVIDYTYGREHSFFDGVHRPLEHIDFSHPFDSALLQKIRDAAAVVNVAIAYGGVYGATQGPRLETAAEIQRMARDGVTLVGMTLMPEAALAREVQLPYASLCLVVNPAAGVSENVITMEEIHQALANSIEHVKQVLGAILFEL